MFEERAPTTAGWMFEERPEDRTVPPPSSSPAGADVTDVVTGQVITAEWGTSVAEDLSEIWAQLHSGVAGDDGIWLGPTPPDNTDILWGDTTEDGSGTYPGPPGPMGPAGPAGPAGAGSGTVSVSTYGAVAGPATIGSTNLAQVRIDTGQSWLLATDTLDLAAFYKAQAYLDTLGGGVITFPPVGTDYCFSSTAFVHSNIDVNLSGSTVRQVGGGPTSYVRMDRCFLFGIFAREDIVRFPAQGWQFSTDDIAAGSRTLSTVSGGTWSVGDTVLIMSTNMDVSVPTVPLPDITTFNVVAAYSAGTITLKHPIEQSIVGPLIVNYSTITTKKSSLIGNGEPHVYYCAANSRLRNGRVIGGNSPAVEWNAAHQITVDVDVDAPRGAIAYGNGLCRSYVRVRGRFGGMKAAIELGIGCNLSTYDVDGWFSGDGYNPNGWDPLDYDVIKVGERAYDSLIKARLRAATKTYSNGLRAIGIRCRYDIDLETEGAVNSGIVFASGGGSGQYVTGRFKSSSVNYHADFNGSDDTLAGVVFSGTPQTQAWRMQGSGNGRIIGCYFPSGRGNFTSATSGNMVTGGYTELAPTSTGTNRANTLTAVGPYPNATNSQTRTLGGSMTVDQAFGQMNHNNGATAPVTMILPSAAPGMQCRFYRVASFAFRADPSGTQTIGTGGAGKYLELGSDKAFIDLVCVVAGEWAIAGQSGTITYEP